MIIEDERLDFRISYLTLRAILDIVTTYSLLGYYKYYIGYLHITTFYFY